ncbi:DUF1858 domain-containing protein [Streptococcus thermophilus]
MVFFSFTIDLSQPVATIIKEHPEVKELLINLGFKPLSNPAMLNTVGKVTSLKAGSKLSNIPLSKIKRTLLFNGYDVIGRCNESL